MLYFDILPLHCDEFAIPQHSNRFGVYLSIGSMSHKIVASLSLKNKCKIGIETQTIYIYTY